MGHLQTRLETLEQRTHTVERQLRWWGVALIIVMLATWATVQAAVFQCPAGDVTCLIAAINTANKNEDDDTITLAAGTYTLTAVDNELGFGGPNGLPIVTSPITMRGAGAERTIIERSPRASDFRLVRVAPTGSLTLEALTLKGGRGECFGSNLIGDLTDCEIMLQPTGLTAEPGLGAFTDDGTPGRGYFPLLASRRAINVGNDTVGGA